MSALTKWNPFRTSSEIDLWGPMLRWNPLREMERMRQEMERFFDRGLLPMRGGEEAMTLSEWSPSVDIIEDDNEFTVKAELPEVNKEDVKVTVEGNILAIRGERKAEKEERGRKFHRIERSYGSFERSFTMPDGTDAEKIKSEFKDGLLVVHMPKNPEIKRKALEVKID